MEFIIVLAFFGLGIGFIHSIDKLRKSLEYDSSRIQSLLAEIRDRFDNKNQG